MKKTFYLLSVFLFAFIVIPTSCYRVEQMSDLNEIHAFNIISYTSETIEIGGIPRTMQISGTPIENDVIYIDVDFGEHLFPLSFHAEPVFQGEIDRIAGIDFSEKLVLETSDSELRFYVMARSGLTRAYTIRTRITPLEESVALFNFFQIKNVEPAMLVSEVGVTSTLFEEDGRRDTLRIFTVAGTFPVTITPEFNIVELSDFGDITAPDGTTQVFVNGETGLRFESPESAYNLTVVSESGLANTWTIVIYHAPFVSGDDGESTPQQRERTDIIRATATATSQTENFVVPDFSVNNDTEEILLVVRNTASETTVFPLEVNLSFAFLSGIQTFGLNNSATSGTFVFEDWDDVQSFYLLDVQTRVSRQWNIRLIEWLSSENMVVAFEYAYTASTVCIQIGNGDCPDESLFSATTLNIEQTLILSQTSSVGHIYLYMAEVWNTARDVSHPWKLTLSDLQIAVSDRATLGDLPAFEWTGNNSWETPISFVVTAQNGSEKTWHVHVRDMRDNVPSSDANLVGLTIVSHTPSHAVFAGLPYQVTLDTNAQIVTLNLTYDRGAYPLNVTFSAETSPFARIISQNNGTDPLIFESENAEQTITIMAEDGTINYWTVNLQPPPRSTEASILTFEVNPMQHFGSPSVTINEERSEIRVWLNTPTTMHPVVVAPNIVYTMTISEWANTSVQLNGTLNFSSFRQRHSFTITAEDGSTREWTVRLIYEPQLQNWNQDATWIQTGNLLNNSTHPPGWATANVSIIGLINITGASRVPRSGGGFATQLRTINAPVVNRPGAGSLFLGWFDRSNAVTFQNDPIRITHFGLPLATSGHIRGIEVDIMYSPGGRYTDDNYRELGSATIELVRPYPGHEGENWVYHGHHADGTPHERNTGMRVAHRQMVFGNESGYSWHGLPIEVVSATEWRTVQILFDDFPNGEMPDFTHLHIVFSSSARGDLFDAVVNSTLTVDNIRILYKEEN